MSSLRVVLDTNAAVSAALFSRSRPRQVVEYVTARGIILMSFPVLDELEAVMRRPRFDRYASVEERINFLDDLIERAEPVEITHRITACRDPKDDKFLELALSGNASHIITGDNDLLALHPFRNIPILTPAAFLAERMDLV